MHDPSLFASGHHAHHTTMKRQIRALERHEGGGSQPQVFGAEDGIAWMVKAKNNPQGTRVLANELVTSALAARLGGSVRRFAICELPVALASSVRFADGQPWAGGAAFGSELIDGGNPVVPAMLAQLVNAEGLLAVVAADTWLQVNDARQALAVTLHGGYAVIAVDFGHVIGSPTWTAEELASRPHPTALTDGNGWVSHRSSGMATRVAARIESVTDEEIAEIVGQVPVEWGLTPHDTDALRRYMIQRRSVMAGLVRQLESKETAA